MQWVKKVRKCERKLRRTSEIALVFGFYLFVLFAAFDGFTLSVLVYFPVARLLSCAMVAPPPYLILSFNYWIRAITLYSGDSIEASYIRLMRSTTTTIVDWYSVREIFSHENRGIEPSLGICCNLVMTDLVVLVPPRELSV
jgi:hypothetical protein